MKVKGAIQGCSSSSQLKSKNETKEEKCGLLSLPDDVALDCLSQVSRLDLVALAMVSRSHRFVAVSRDLRAMRYRLGKLDPYLYVFMHMYPDPSPKWFVLHPLQHRLKPVHHSSFLYPAPLAGSCFVTTDWGVYCIGGLINGKPTSEVTFFNAINHLAYRAAPMKMARSGASASLIDKKKIYVFGGCWDVANSSNWVEVFDMETGIWEFLFVFTPKMPLNIQQSVVINGQSIYGVDEDGQIFHFTPSTTSPSMFTTNGIVEPNPENRNDWFLFEAVMCRGIGGRILWRRPDEIRWKEVKGLEELQQQHIIKICSFSEKTIAIFWEARGGPQQQCLLELWYAEISMNRYLGDEIWANIESSAAVLSDSSHTSSFNLLYAANVFA
ncbi:hypothetical protein Bca4012_061522 [Brassica carinata]